MTKHRNLQIDSQQTAEGYEIIVCDNGLIVARFDVGSVEKRFEEARLLKKELQKEET